MKTGRGSRVRIDARVPHGNAAGTRVGREGNRTEVRFTPSPHGGPECLWFRFRIVPPRAPRPHERRIRLTLENPQNMLGGEWRPGRESAGLRPVMRAGAGGWRRLGEAAARTTPDGRLLASWNLPLPPAGAEVAFCYPYGREELDLLLRETSGRWRTDVIGLSQGGRPILRLANRYGRTAGRRESGVYILARQHSGETPGSWVLDGILRRTAELGNRAPMVWAVPFANPDGVEQGDYGKDNFPIDLNRAWGVPPLRHENLVMMNDVMRWKDRCAPLLALDLHAPGARERDGAYFFVPRDRRGRLARLARRHAAALARKLGPLAARRPLVVAGYASRWETPRFTDFASSLGVPGLALETPYAMCRSRMLARDDYRLIGCLLADGITKIAERK